MSVAGEQRAPETCTGSLMGCGEAVFPPALALYSRTGAQIDTCLLVQPPGVKWGGGADALEGVFFCLLRVSYSIAERVRGAFVPTE